MTALRDRVIVITGASSGLGRELAILSAAEGAALVLAARDEGRLEETAGACRAAGGEALSVVTDVTSEADVGHLTERALSFKGRIDVWVNNAGVTLFAPIGEATFEEHRRVIETNLYGAMLSARAVLPIFKQQRRGVLINVGSILSRIGHPFAPSYAISKFALRGLSEVLRVELADEPDIHVCSVFPYAMNTPHFASGANRVGLRARTMPPDQAPEKVARAIVGLVKKPKRELYVPRVAALGLALHELMPDTVETLLLHALQRWHFDRVPEPSSTGNLYRPNHRAEPPGFDDGIHGRRQPRIGTTAFLAWAIGDLVATPVRRIMRSRTVSRATHPI